MRLPGPLECELLKIKRKFLFKAGVAIWVAVADPGGIINPVAEGCAPPLALPPK
jgi:hypothetical protein